MPLYSKYVAVLAKEEAIGSYGVDSVPSGAGNYILTKGANLQPLLGDKVARDVDRGNWGAQTEINTGPLASVSFSIEMSGAGSATQPLVYNDLLFGCGFAESIQVDRVVYSLINGNIPSVTLYYFVDGLRHIIKGARGSVRFSIQRNQIPTLDFTFVGLYTRPTTVAIPALSSAMQAAHAVTKQNTPTITLHGTTVNCESFSLDLQNTTTYRNIIGSEKVEITDRNIRGSVTIEAPTLATKDYFAASEALLTPTLSSIQLIHGYAGGNLIQFDAPNVQLGPPTIGSSDGILTYTMDMVLTSNAGNDELTYTTR